MCDNQDMPTKSSTTKAAKPAKQKRLHDPGAGPVLVGYDGSIESWNALRYALGELAPGTRIIVVSALRRERALPLPVPSFRGAETAHARLEALYLSDTEAIDDDLELVVEDAAPGPALLRLADERDARLIIVGHHHRGRSARLHASVVDHLLRHSPVPVVVVPGDPA